MSATKEQREASGDSGSGSGSGSTGASSPAAAAATAPGGFLSSLLHKLKEKDAANREREDRMWSQHASGGSGSSATAMASADGGATAGGSPAAPASAPAPLSSPTSTAAAAAASGIPDREQAALVAATLQARKDKERTTSTAAASSSSSTKDKFLDFFKSDAEKKRAAAADAQAQAAAAAAAAAAEEERRKRAAALEPIKLELQCAEAGQAAMVGRALRASAAPPASAAAHAQPAPVGVRGVCRWFRASDDGFDQLAESVAPIYVPTLDDVDCRVCCQWLVPAEEAEERPTPDATTADATVTAASAGPASSSSAAGPPRPPALQSSFAEIGPIAMDPALLAESAALFQAGKAVFVVREEPSEELVSVTVKRTMIRILPAKGGEAKFAFLLRKTAAAAPAPAAAATNATAGVSTAAAPAASGTASASTPSVQFRLDHSDPLRFSIEDAGAQRLFRGRMHVESDSLAEYARARRLRDAMACLVRRIVRTGSEAIPVAAESTAARVDPVSAAPAAGDAPQTSADAAAGEASGDSASPPPATANDAAPLSELLLLVEVQPAPIDSGDLVRVVVAPAAPLSASAPEPRARATGGVPAIAVPAAPSKPMSTDAMLAPPPPSLTVSLSPISPPGASPAAAFSSSSSPSLSSLSQRISELSAEKNLYRENLNLVLLDKQRAEASFRADRAALAAQLEARDSELASLRRELDQRGEDVDALKLAIQNLSTQMSSLANTEVRLSGEIRSLKNEREAAQAELRSTREAHAARIGEMDAAQSKLERESRLATEAHAAASAELSTLRSEVRRLGALEERHARSVESEQNLRHDLAVVKAEAARLRELQQKLDVVEMENHQLRKERDKARRSAHTHAAAAAAAANRLDTSSPASSAPRSASDSAGAAVSATSSAETSAEPPVAMDPAAISATDAAGSQPTTPVTPAPAVSAKPQSSGSSTPVRRSGAATPNGRDFAPSASGNAAAGAALQLLSDQHGQLQEQHAALAALHTSTLSQLHEAQQQLSALQSSCDSHSAALGALSSQHSSLTAAHEELLASRNYYKRKCESLSASVDKMLHKDGLEGGGGGAGGGSRGMTPSNSSGKLAAERSPSDKERQAERERHAAEVRQLQSTVAHLRTESSELQQTLQAYKRTLESNYELLKYEREANLVLSKGGASGAGGGGGGLFSRGKSAALQVQFDSVRALANSLSELVADKDLSIEHLKKSNLILGRRLSDLERRFAKELQADDADTAAGKNWYGKAHLDQMEQAERRRVEAVQASRNGSRRNSVGEQSSAVTATAVTASAPATSPPTPTPKQP